MVKPSLLASLVAVAALVIPTTAQAADFSVGQASVTPKLVFADSAKDAVIEFRIEAAGPRDVAVRMLSGGRTIRETVAENVLPGSRVRTRWDGDKLNGKPAPDGRYRVTAGPVNAPGKAIGAVTLRGHAFPVRAPHGVRGGVGEFGASRNGGRTHEGFDVVASCGRPLVAARAGRVIRRGYDPVLYGNFVEIRGVGERRSYFYAHMVRPAEVDRGEEVGTGERVGRIGLTGNARGTPCHLHFEIHLGGKPVDPEPDLRAWDRYS